MTNDLVARAASAREQALASFSNFKVGAAVRTAEGEIYDGCNVESVSYGLTVCAERVALWKALSEGEREFTEIAIVTDTAKPTPPCGACRQLLWEYCGNIRVVLCTSRGDQESHSLSELFPRPFETGRSG